MNYSKLKWVFIFYGFTSYANDWGKTGHRVIGQIAEQYISEKTKKSITDFFTDYCSKILGKEVVLCKDTWFYWE